MIVLLGLLVPKDPDPVSNRPHGLSREEHSVGRRRGQSGGHLGAGVRHTAALGVSSSERLKGAGASKFHQRWETYWSGPPRLPPGTGFLSSETGAPKPV